MKLVPGLASVLLIQWVNLIKASIQFTGTIINLIAATQLHVKLEPSTLLQ